MSGSIMGPGCGSLIIGSDTSCTDIGSCVGSMM